MTGQLERVTFSMSRAADFLDERALVSQTGRPAHDFGNVVTKELIDNALDACETSGRDPDVLVAGQVAGGVQHVTVSDQGDGIASDVVERILDYSTLTSDKALYRSPCRGAQGNALKTLIGIGQRAANAPVVIEARGVRHEIRVGLDAAGQVRVDHHQAASERVRGTSVTIPLPEHLEAGVYRWALSYALVNPHAAIGWSEQGYEDRLSGLDIYKPTAAEGWRKPMPGDPTSALWYDRAAFTRLACSLAALGDDRPIGKFIAEFRDLSGTAKRKEIAAGLPPDVRRVADLADRPDVAAHMLSRMQALSNEVSPARLGRVPEEHYRQLIDRECGIERHWYRHGGIVAGGIPWHIEVFIAETRQAGLAFWACNYAASFGDPLGGTRAAYLQAGDVHGYGSAGFLTACDAMPSASNDGLRVVVVHVTCAAPVHTDKGKTGLDVPAEVAAAFANVMWQAGKELYREARSAATAGRKAAAAANRRAGEERKAARRERMTMKDAVFEVIPEAVRLQQGGTTMVYSARDLFYKVRPLVQRLAGIDISGSYNYFTQQLLPEYQRLYGPLQGLYYDARGELHEPHDPDGKRVIRLGTREVAVYKPPEWTYDKILVTEKSGLWEKLSAARIGDRYDMAIVLGQGFAVEACRSLLAEMPPGDVKIFALHDADPAGYNIAITLGEETRRMPDHHVDVIDLGLTVDDAIGFGFRAEEFIRKVELPRRLHDRLAGAAREWFEGTVISWKSQGRPARWRCQRVELNEFSSPGLIAYIEDGLARHAAAGKVVPPAKVLRRELRDLTDTTVRHSVEKALAELADADSIVLAVQRIVRRRDRRNLGSGDVRSRLNRNRAQSWRTATAVEALGRFRASGADVDRLVATLLRSRLDDTLSKPGESGDSPGAGGDAA